MNEDGINIKLHHGGTFSKDGELKYMGGEVSKYRNCDIDRMSYFELVAMAKDVGYSDGYKLFYTIPGFNLEAGIDQIHDDSSVTRMLKFAKPKSVFDIYIQPAEPDVSGKAIENPADESVDVPKKTIRKKKRKIDPVGEKQLSQVKREKRTWSAEEESVLVDILYEMKNMSWKVDTGFKVGYLPFVEKEMGKRLPNCVLKADPHIKSKIKLMKRSLSYILDIQRNGSGFGWDDDQKMVTGDREVYLEWAKSREGSAALFMKPFPHYDKLVEIYAKDLATGDRAKGPGDVSDVEEDEGDSNFDLSRTNNQVVGESNSHTQGTNNTPTPTVSKQSKRKSSEFDSLELDFVQMSKSISSLIDAEKNGALSINDIKKAFTHQVDVYEQASDKRKQLFEVLRTLPGLGAEEVVKATRLIGQDATKMDLFYTMPDDFKIIFVRQEIDGALF